MTCGVGSLGGGLLDWVTYWAGVTEQGVESEEGDWGVVTYWDGVTGLDEENDLDVDSG